MGAANCKVYNDTKEKMTIYAFSYSDGIRLAPTTTHTLSPGQTKEFTAGADFRGLIIATDRFGGSRGAIGTFGMNGRHFYANNGETYNSSEILKSPGNGWASPLTVGIGIPLVVVGTGIAIANGASPIPNPQTIDGAVNLALNVCALPGKEIRENVVKNGLAPAILDAFMQAVLVGTTLHEMYKVAKRIERLDK